MMIRKLITCVSLTICFQCTFAQLYTTAAGLRMGTDWGITVQQRVLDKVTIEGILQSSLQREEALLTILLERHHSLISKGLNFYTGIGLHKGWLNTQNTESSNNNPFGTTFVLGAELTVGRLNISYDFKPAVNLSGGEKRFYSQTGISMRYVLLKNKVFKKYQKNKKRKSKNSNGRWWEFWN